MPQPPKFRLFETSSDESEESERGSECEFEAVHAGSEHEPSVSQDLQSERDCREPNICQEKFNLVDVNNQFCELLLKYEQAFAVQSCDCDSPADIGEIRATIAHASP